MARFDGGYSAEGGEVMRDIGPLPNGEYVMTMVKSDVANVKPPSANKYLACEFSVYEGQFEGRRAWSNLNLWNDNQQAAEIAQRELNSIMHACGKLRIDDSEELHGIPMLVRIGLDKDNSNKNKILGYKPLTNGAANAIKSAVQGGASAPQQSSAPWKRTA